MSSSRKPRKHRSGKRQSFQVVWSDWQWDDTHKFEYRSRQIADSGTDEDFEYEYRNNTETTPRSSGFDPTTQINTVSNNQDVGYEGGAAGGNYTHAVDSAAEALAQITLRSGRTQFTGYANPAPFSYSNYSPPGFNTAPTQQLSYNYNSPAASYQQVASSITPSRSYVAHGDPSLHTFPYSQTPALGNGGHIRSQDTKSTVNIDSSYKVHGSFEFKFGRVLRVLWSEPTGVGGTELTGRDGRIRKAKFNEEAYDSIRRFLIVREGQGHCTCLPILTYGGRATTKSGVRGDDHAVIYTFKHPTVLPKERMSKKAIQMKPFSQQIKLDPMSRVNYAKVYTIEHNIKVDFIGSIISRHEQRVVTDFNLAHQPLAPRHHGPLLEESEEHFESPFPSYSPQGGNSGYPQRNQEQHLYPHEFSAAEPANNIYEQSAPTDNQDLYSAD